MHDLHLLCLTLFESPLRICFFRTHSLLYIADGSAVRSMHLRFLADTLCRNVARMTMAVRERIRRRVPDAVARGIIRLSSVVGEQREIYKT